MPSDTPATTASKTAVLVFILAALACFVTYRVAVPLRVHTPSLACGQPIYERDEKMFIHTMFNQSGTLGSSFYGLRDMRGIAKLVKTKGGRFAAQFDGSNNNHFVSGDDHLDDPVPPRIICVTRDARH